MKLPVYLSLVCLILISCTEQKVVNVIIKNPSAFDRTAEVLEIPIEELKTKINLGKDQTFIVKTEANEIIPSQITYDGQLIFQSGVKANETARFTISAGELPVFQSKTFGRFIPERKDDFAWENDRVAFRVYGPTLKEFDGPSNGIDLWYKRTENLIIDKWYKNDLAGVSSYHTDNGEGLDDYKVGRTLGAGAMAPYINQKLYLNENFISQELLDNGPLRTTFRLVYDDIDENGSRFSDSRLISLDAGSQLTRIKQSFGTQEVIPVAAGIVKREGKDSILQSISEKGISSIIYAEPFSDKVQNVYVGMVFSDGLEQVKTDTYTIVHDKTGKEQTHSHILGVTKYQPGNSLTYYTGYGWSKFGFPTLEDFQQYMKQFVESLEKPLIITY